MFEKELFPREVLICMDEDAVLEELEEDGYDSDSEDEESGSLLAHEMGNSMETIEVESIEDLSEQMRDNYPEYHVVDHDVADMLLEYEMENGI